MYYMHLKYVLYVSVYVCMYAYMYVCVYACICIYMYVWMLYAFMHYIYSIYLCTVCMYSVCMYIYANVYTQYACMYVCIHMHITHTYPQCHRFNATKNQPAIEGGKCSSFGILIKVKSLPE